MKRLMIAALALSMSVCLCACGSSQTSSAEEANSQPLSPVMDTAPASDSSAADTAALPPASETDAQPEETAPANGRYTEAQEYIGRSAAELIAALGEPQSSEYASSCDVENAEDGMLQYDGFYVWTLKTADDELVRDVYLDE